MAILSAYAGYFPWKKQKRKLDDKTGYSWQVGITGYGEKKGKTGPYATGGWTVIQPDQYTKNPQKPEMVQLQVYSGRKSYVPIGDVETFVGFQKLKPEEINDEMVAYVQKSFASSSGRGRYYEFDGVGHIAHVRYNPTFQVMEVTFVNRGDVVTFMRVPKELYLEFEHHAKSNSMSLGVDGTQRHLLGIRFWDLVRIRGQRTGARYPFTYTTNGITAGSGAKAGYAEAMERQNSPQAQQPVDAIRESTIEHTEQPSEAEANDIEKEQLLSKLQSQLDKGSLSTGQLNAIRKMRDLVEDKYGMKSKEYMQFSAAVTQGWGAITNIANRLKLWG
jgi:hypothetical protein